MMTSVKMAGSTGEASSSRAPETAAIAKKLVIHSKSDPCGAKFLKYLQYASVLKKGSSTSHSSGSPWMELKTSGALEAIMVALKKVFICQHMKSLTDNMELTKPCSLSTDARSSSSVDLAKDICKIGLSILGNAFALDYSVRAQAVNNGFVSSLQQFISTFSQSSKVVFQNSEIISRAVKCTANLSNDSYCRESVMKTGVAISILKILELADEVVSKNDCRAEPEEYFVDKSHNANLICACVRAIRILASDSKFVSSGRDHLLKFGGLVAVANVLTWGAKLSSNEDLVLDVIRALTLLSVKIKSAPYDIVQELIYNPEASKIRCLVRIFETSQPEGKLYFPVINCLINLSSNKEISDCLGGLRIFHIILEKLESSDENHYHDMVKLLIALTRYSSFNQSHLATSSLIGSTLKILKSSRFKEFHAWLLMVYEKLYEGSLSKLISCGLVNHLCEILREELEDCDYDCLRKKITSFDDGRCSVHQLQEDGVCPFAPVYRCSSPSYQQIQEEMKLMSSISENGSEYQQQIRGDDSLSPFSSPAHSWTSGSSSPFYSGASHASYSSLSEDEGCYSPTPIPPKKRLRSCSPDVTVNYSETHCMDGQSLAVSDADGDSDEQGPTMKKLKLEDGSSSSFSDNGTIKKHHSDKSLEALKSSVKKIVSVLNIIYKCTYVTPFPDSILPITPILLGIIVRGKVSLMPQRVEYQTMQSDDEFYDLSRRSFEVSYKIFLKMCSIIQIFPEIIVSGIVPVLHRLQEPICSTNSKMDEQIGVVQDYCKNLITRMVGQENDTAGWREGFIMRTLLVNNIFLSSEKMAQTILNIPLLYEKHPAILRKFEMKAKSWTKILDMLVNSDETSFYRFEDCALALCSICSAIGVEWRAHDANSEVPLLFNVPPEERDSGIFKIMSSEEISNIPIQEELMVRLTLDDGSNLLVKKDLLINASPVFWTMFNGSFIEAGEQKVHLPTVSTTTVCLLLDQIYMLSKSKTTHTSSDTKYQSQYELDTIFELFTLADRFLLDDVYERALNTLITKYICPYSAPIIYAESVKLVNLQRSAKQMLGDSGLNLFILKYILTAKSIRMSERCNAIRKVFDTVIPEHVVRDLKLLIEHHMYKSR